MELLAKLGIDWTLLVAQLINFTILMVLLTYFVYKPILRLLDDRRERVRKSMEDAKKIENQKREIDQFRVEQLRKVDEECGKFLETAKTQAEAVKKEILAGAEKEAAQVLSKAREQVGEERERLLQETQETLASVIVRMTEKILEKEFTGADQQRLLTQVKKQLPTMIQK
jgi:F-type H+-transporting ATPase subunit b